MVAQQATRAKEITPNLYGIPLPSGFIMSGTMGPDTPFPNLIEVTEEEWATISVGDLVINTTVTDYALVEALGPGIGKVFITNNIMNASDNYEIWKKVEPESACTLFIPFGGTVSVVTAGNDSVNFTFAADTPSILPVGIVRLEASDGTNVIALW